MATLRILQRGGRHRDTTQVKGLSPEISQVSVAEAVKLLSGRSTIAGKGEAIVTRRGLRPCQDVKGSSYELGRANAFPKRMRQQAYKR